MVTSILNCGWNYAQFDLLTVFSKMCQMSCLRLKNKVKFTCGKEV